MEYEIDEINVGLQELLEEMFTAGFSAGTARAPEDFIREAEEAGIDNDEFGDDLDGEDEDDTWDDDSGWEDDGRYDD